jgi:hypothetical protein
MGPVDSGRPAFTAATHQALSIRAQRRNSISIVSGRRRPCVRLEFRRLDAFAVRCGVDGELVVVGMQARTPDVTSSPPRQSVTASESEQGSDIGYDLDLRRQSCSTSGA